MLLDEEEPRKKPPAVKNLSGLSVEDLGQYITQLEDEITRVKDEIASRQNVHAAAHALFKKHI